MRASFFAVACLTLAGVTPAPSPMPEPSPSPALTQSPSPSPSPAPTATPAASASSSPTPLATPSVLMLPADAAPQILYVSLSSTTPHAGDTVLVTVLASSNVASVELRIGGYGAGMTKTDVGHFQMSSVVPRLPFFMSHNLTLQIIARNTSGVAVERDVSMQVR